MYSEMQHRARLMLGLQILGFDTMLRKKLSYAIAKRFCYAGEIYVTSKRYVAVEDDELSFEIGVNLQILEKNYDGWWKAS